MKMILRRYIKTCIPFLLIGMVGVLVANKGLFTHLHKLDNNTIVSHAHPYDKSSDSEPFKDHDHTGFEYAFFEQLELLYSFAFIVLALSPVLAGISFTEKALQRHCSGLTSFRLGRSPPQL